jgi:hypothetical protein
MADQDKKISDLSAAGSLGGTEKIPLVQSGTLVRTTLSAIASFITTGFVDLSTAQTLTNKRITKRIYESAFDASLPVDSDQYDIISQTAISNSISITNPTGVPTNLQQLEFFLLDDGTPRNITWDTNYSSYVATLPTTTTAGKCLVLTFRYKAAKWQLISSLKQA